MDKLQAAAQFRRAVQMFAAQLPEAQAREVATIYPQWAPDTTYVKDQYISHGEDANGDPKLYRVEQGHTSSKVYPPDGEGVTALYTCITLDSSGRPIWAPPTGAQDAYDIGDIVSHKGQLWRSKRGGNTSEPGTDEWWEIYEEGV